MWAFREWWKTKIDRFWGEEGEHKGTDHNKLDLKFKKKSHQQRGIGYHREKSKDDKRNRSRGYSGSMAPSS